MLKFVEIDGKRYAWKDIVRLRREQIAAERSAQQLTLFELRAPLPRNATTDSSLIIGGARLLYSLSLSILDHNYRATVYALVKCR
jgi:hypothetical protein